jgi:hypothetical protein
LQAREDRRRSAEVPQLPGGGTFEVRALELDLNAQKWSGSGSRGGFWEDPATRAVHRTIPTF